MIIPPLIVLPESVELASELLVSELLVILRGEVRVDPLIVVVPNSPSAVEDALDGAKNR